jgi:anti-anti-sigma factor
MTRIKLEYNCETPDGTDGLVVYSLTGNLLGSPEAYAFQDDVRSKVAAGLQKIVIDLDDTEKIDSCGVGILASVMWSASQAGGGMVLVSVPEQVEKVLGIVMLLDRIDHADSCDQAITMLQPL